MEKRYQLTARVEKYKGVTLIVNDASEWMSVVWDATGHIFEGPVHSDEDVVFFAKVAIETLKKLNGDGTPVAYIE